MKKEKILKTMIDTVNKDDYTHNKMCITFIGGPGSGKTTISNLLCEKMNLFHCSNDYIARQLDECGIDTSNYEEKTKLVSDIAFPFQDYLFQNNIDFVLDANLMLYLDVIRKRCENYGYKLFVLEININPDEALKRSLKRLKMNNPDNLSNSDEADFQLYLKQYEEYKKTENRDYIFKTVNTEENDFEEQIDNIIVAIKKELN